MKCTLVVVDKPEFKVNMKAIAFHTWAKVLSASTHDYPPISNLYINICAGIYVYSTEHNGKWYHLYVIQGWADIDRVLVDLLESGLEPYQAFEVLAL